MSKNVEQIFKESFENFEQAPNPELWNRINKKIYKKTIIKKTSIFLSTVAVLLSVFLLYNNTSKVDSEILIPNQITYKITNRNTNQLIDNEIVAETTTLPKLTNETQNLNKNKLSEENLIIVKVNEASDATVQQIPPTTSEKSAKNKFEGFTLSEKNGCCPLTFVVENKETESNDLLWEIDNKKFLNTDAVNVTINNPGTYKISLTRNDNGTQNTYIDSVTIYEKPIADFKFPENTFENKTVKFENTSKFSDKYVWYINNLKMSNKNNFEYTFSDAGTYRVKLIALNNFKCSDTIEKSININNAKESIIVPNAFTPSTYGANGGYYSNKTKDNSTFYPIFFKNIAKYNLVIYNKKGQIVFETDNPKIGWDGYYRNKIVEVGVYIYSLNCTFEDNEVVKKQGSITVIYNR